MLRPLLPEKQIRLSAAVAKFGEGPVAERSGIAEHLIAAVVKGAAISPRNAKIINRAVAELEEDSRVASV